LSIDRRGRGWCLVTFDHPPINTSIAEMAGEQVVVPGGRLPDVGPFDRLRGEGDSAASGAPAVVAPLRWMKAERYAGGIAV
jgi:hypothetical protein